jgi:glycosyltransferase involved in cell wall biosynthesis
VNVARAQNLQSAGRFRPLSARDAGIIVGQADEPLLSVVLPNYNHARYLLRAIDAIAAQDNPPDEIIVVDDASTDNSLDILADCQGRYSNLIVLTNARNCGTIATLQRGLEVARGRYIYFGAADDQVLPGFFDSAVKSLQAAPTIGLFCAETLLVDGITGKTTGIRPVVRPLRTAGGLSPQRVEALLKRADNFIHTGSCIFRRRSVLDKGGFMTEAGSFGDGLLARKIALTEGMWFMPNVVATWFIHADGLSRATALDRDKAIDALTTVPRLIESDRDFPSWYAELFERRWRFGSARLALDCSPPDRDLLAALTPNTGVDQAVISALAPLARFQVARLAILTWLTLRLRPFRLRDVVATALGRASEGRSRG